MSKDPFGFTKTINFDKLNDPKVLKELEKIFIKDAPLEERKEFVKKIKKEKDEQTTWASNGPRIPAALAMAPGSGSKLQASSLKLQAPSFRVDKIKLQEYKGDKTCRVATETR